MMWIVSFSAAPMYGIWKRGINTPRFSESYSLNDTTYLGIITGNFWDYNITGILWGNGTERDSVFLVGLTPDTLGRCVFVGGLPGANYQVDMTTDSSGRDVDTGFIYFRQGYDNLYGDGGLMVMKYMPSVGNTWEAWDTCLIPLFQKFPIGDIDGDMIIDSVWVKPSSATVHTISSDTIRVRISPLKYTVWVSSLDIFYGVDSIELWDYYRFVYVANFGKIEEHLDSERIRYFMFGFPVLDTTYRNVYHKVIPSAATSEYPRIVSGDKSVEIYTVSGRLIGRNMPINRKGTYFIVINTERGRLVRKVIVR